jgi:hypothetical protein
MFEGIVAVPNSSEVDWDDDKDRVPDKVRKGFPEVGEELKASFSKNAPAEIEYIVIVSDIEKISCEVHQNEKMLGVPVRGYVATMRRVNRTEWEDSIREQSSKQRFRALLHGIERLKELTRPTFRRQDDGAERITATGTIVNISKQKTETSHGLNIVVDDCKTQGIEREKFRQITNDSP